jgi:hypothetical protein
VVNFEGLADNLIPLCGFDAPFPRYGLVPAVIGSGVYLGLAWLSVAKGKPWLWLVASFALPLTYALVQTQVLSVLDAHVIC